MHIRNDGQFTEKAYKAIQERGSALLGGEALKGLKGGWLEARVHNGKVRLVVYTVEEIIETGLHVERCTLPEGIEEKIYCPEATEGYIGWEPKWDLVARDLDDAGGAV
jgi:hypothetical protein